MDSGILNVAKPVGFSSFAVVRSIARLPGVTKVGHGGTLDPAAEGVLPILVNAATRMADFVHRWPKTYLATAAFGFTSDSYDREGVISRNAETVAVTEDQILSELPRFVGRIDQVPPMHSALKLKGEALYRKARRGETVVREPRPVDVFSIKLLDYDAGAATARLEIVSGQGMYVRSLVHDLGQRLGCGAYLAALARSAYGPLRLEDALTPAALDAAGVDWHRHLLPMDLPLRDWAYLRLDPADAESVVQGRAVLMPTAADGRYRLLDGTDSLLGWGLVAAGRLQPKAIFPR
jgi:tRNA pseudouridine55 synthase